MQHPSRSNSPVGSSLPTVLIVDPFVEKTFPIEAAIRALGYDVVTLSTIAEGMAAFDRLRPLYVLTELRFTDGCGLDFLRYALSTHPTARVVVHTWFADLQVAVAATKAGAYDFVPKPTDSEFLANILLLGAANVPEECKILDPNQLRRQHIEHVMHTSRTNVSLAARTLLLDRRSLQRLLRRHEANQ